MTRFHWLTRSGNTRMIDADLVTFEPGHVAFWRGGRLVVAEQNADVHQLKEARG